MDTSNNKNILPNGKFSLNDVLEENPNWVKAISQKVWHDVRSNPKWAQLVNVNERLIVLEQRLSSMESKINLILINQNGGGSQ